MKKSELVELIKEELLNEVTYRKYKYSEGKPHQKINTTINEINSKLIRVERMLKQVQKLKSESGTDNSSYWKKTNTKLRSMRERIYKIMNGINNLHS